MTILEYLIKSTNVLQVAWFVWACIDNCNMFHQIVQSAINKGWVKFVGTQIDGQYIPVGSLDGQKLLHRLTQADSFKDEKVKVAYDGIKVSSKEIVRVHNEDILEGGNSIKVTMKTLNTRDNRKKFKDRWKQNQRRQRPP